MIHVGHRSLFKKCVELGGEVTVGVTFEPLIAKYHGVPGFEARSRRVSEFFRMKFGVDPKVVKLLDHAGPVLSDSGYSHLVTSEENLPYACEINIQRVSRGLPPVEIVLVPTVKAYDGRPVSTTRILNGEIDMLGKRVARSVTPTA